MLTLKQFLPATTLCFVFGVGSGIVWSDISHDSSVQPTAGLTLAAAPLPSRAAGSQTRALPKERHPREVASTAQKWTVSISGGRMYGAGVLAGRGYALTNLHVVEKAPEITVTFFDGNTAKATIVDADEKLDLALLQLNKLRPEVAPVASFMESQVGDEVISVGSPRKMSFTVSRGMISYLGRFMKGVAYVQTDISTNGGNSGGPLVNMRGEVIGIVSFILKNSQGLSFAIPIDYAYERFSQHLATESLDMVKFKQWTRQHTATASRR